VLYREPMWLKCFPRKTRHLSRWRVSVLYREPMWLKCRLATEIAFTRNRFSALP